MTISSRYARSVLILFAVAFIPTLMNSYLADDLSLKDRRMPLIPLELGAFHGTDKPRHSAPWFEKHFYTEDWIQRDYVSPGNNLQVTLFAARSFEARPLFYLPETTLFRTVPTERTVHRETLTTAYGVIPIRMIEFSELGEHRVALYALFYGTRPVANPYLFYLSILPELFIGHREPMTLIFVDTAVAEGRDTSLAIQTTQLILHTACESFLNLSNHSATKTPRHKGGI